MPETENIPNRRSILGGMLRMPGEYKVWQSQQLTLWNMILTLEGECRIKNNYGSRMMHAGDVFLCAPSTERTFSLSGPWKSIWFSFDLTMQVNWEEPVKEFYMIHPPADQFERIKETAKETLKLIFYPESAWYLLAQNHINGIVLRGNALSEKTHISKQLMTGTDFLLSCRTIPHIEDAAAKAGMSRTNFFKAFHSAYGVSPQKYYEKVKLTKVRDLLVTTDLNYSEIAEICGFSSLSYLSRRFRNVYHITMRQFRRSSGL